MEIRRRKNEIGGGGGERWLAGSVKTALQRKQTRCGQNIEVGWFHFRKM